jgi:hypothetical protein
LDTVRLGDYASWREVAAAVGRRRGISRVGVARAPGAILIASFACCQIAKELTSPESIDESQKLVLTLDFSYHEGWLVFYTKRDFVRKSFGGLGLRLVILCIQAILRPPADLFHAEGAEVAERAARMVFSAFLRARCVSNFFVFDHSIVRVMQQVGDDVRRILPRWQGGPNAAEVRNETFDRRSRRAQSSRATRFGDFLCDLCVLLFNEFAHARNQHFHRQ